MVDPQEQKKHLSEVESWHSKRLEELRKPDGWLSVIGLHWLKPGENTFGSDPDNNVVLPELPGIMGKAGSFIVDKTVVRLVAEPDALVTIQGEKVTDSIIFGKSKIPVIVRMGSLQWQVIKRQNLIGIRLRDLANPKIGSFKGIERYPVSLDWRIPARFERYDPPKRIEIENILGHVSKQTSPGAVKFKVDSTEYRLDTTGDPKSKSFFIVFGDETNGEETYYRGRFLTVDAPDEQGNLYIDFNKAYTPPCGFTEYATCPIPPPQNMLPIRVEAGEKHRYTIPLILRKNDG